MILDIFAGLLLFGAWLFLACPILGAILDYESGSGYWESVGAGMASQVVAALIAGLAFGILWAIERLFS